jgi:hypothetical protein
MTLFPSLFAAKGLGDFIEVIIFLLVFILPVISQFLKKMREMPPPDKRPIPPRSAEPKADVAAEIEKFMRQAAERRRPPKGEGRVPAEKPKTAPAAATVGAAVQAAKETEPVRPVGGQLRTHVEQYLDEKEFQRRESELGKTIASADEKIDAHLHETFDHRVSRLETATGEGTLVGAIAEVSGIVTTDWLQVLTNPDSLRNAIILNEVLRRPEERWD